MNLCIRQSILIRRKDLIKINKSPKKTKKKCEHCSERIPQKKEKRTCLNVCHITAFIL